MRDDRETPAEYTARYKREAAARIAAQPVNRCHRCRVEISILNDSGECGPCSGDRRRGKA